MFSVIEFYDDFLAYDESRTISAGIGSPVDNTKMKPLPNVQVTRERSEPSTRPAPASSGTRSRSTSSSKIGTDEFFSGA